ncbi:MAG: hypothetical protein K8U57_37785 [Planctomycetes bacterium]|nr:hypothetical protein [Planctomycetota bacterium]
MAAYVEAIADQFDFSSTDDWKEIIDSGAQPASSHLSLDAQEATLVGYVPWNKQRSAARYFLGFAYADTVSPYRLHRETPFAHPEFPWLFAYDVSFTPFIAKSNPAADAGGKPKIRSKFEPAFYSTYSEFVICTVRFRSFRMEFLADNEIDTNEDEYRRNTYFDVDPRVEALSADGVGQLKFAEGAAPPAGPNGTPFPAPIATLLAKTGFVLNWLNVPWEYLTEEEFVFKPTKILDCVGKVNSDTFMGTFTHSTCLMNPPRFTFKPFPVPDAADPRRPRWAVDVQIPFDYFAPPKDASYVGSSYQGHQLMPFRGDGKFYGAVRDNGTSELLEYNTFNQIFQHVSE